MLGRLKSAVHETNPCYVRKIPSTGHLQCNRLSREGMLNEKGCGCVILIIFNSSKMLSLLLAYKTCEGSEELIEELYVSQRRQRFGYLLAYNTTVPVSKEIAF